MVHRHWQDVASSAHFLPLQGRQLGLGDGDGEGEKVVGGSAGIGGGGVGVGVGGACVLDRGRAYEQRGQPCGQPY